MKKLFTITVLFAIFSLSSKAQWQYTGLDSTDVFSLASKGEDTIFAGTNRGMYLSPNNGRTWTSLGLVDSATVTTIAIIGNNIFAGTWGSGLYISANNGTTWTSGTSLACDDIDQLAVIGDNVLGATFCDTYLSSNYGHTWSDIHNDLPFYTYITSFGVSGSNLWAGTQGSGVFYSSDQGLHWTAKNNNFSDTTMAGDTTEVDAFAIEGDSVYVGTYGSGVFFSPDLGNTWSREDTGITDLGINANAMAVKGKYLFAGTTYQGVILSENNGHLWRPVNNGLGSNTLVQALIIVGDTIFAGVDGGVYKDWITDDGSGINEVNKGCIMAVYPNPAVNYITVESPQNALIEITNLQGQMVKTFSAVSNKTTIGVSSFPNGIYIIKAISEKGIDVEKFVKQ